MAKRPPSRTTAAARSATRDERDAAGKALRDRLLAIARFSRSDAIQVECDHKAFLDTIRDGRIEAPMEH